MEPTYVPIADRTAAELGARAAELRKMASTATTPGVMHSLLILADRYTAAEATKRDIGPQGN
jgi:hypothetical protein